MPTQPEPGEDALTVVNEATGVTHGKILSYRINTQYTTPTDSWDFTVFSEDNPRKLRHTWRPLQPIKLLIAGNQQVVGRIDGTRGTGESGAALQVHGRDYLADIVDSTVDPQFQIKKSQDIGAFLLELLKPWGITTIFGNFNLTRNVASGRKPFNKNPAKHYKSAKLEDTKASENQGVFEFANTVVARQGFVILPAGTRDAVCVDQPNYEQAPLYTLSRPGNILSGTADRNYASLPTVVIARGRTGGSTPGQQSLGGVVDKPAITPYAGTPSGQPFAADSRNDTQGTGRRDTTTTGQGSQFAGNPANNVNGTGRRAGSGLGQPTGSQFAANPANNVQGTGRRDEPQPNSAIGPSSGGVSHGTGRFGTFDESAASPIGKILEVQRAITSDDGIVVVREKRFDPKKGDNTTYGYDPPVYKPLFYRDKDSRNDEQLEYSVRRAIAEKLRETLVYTCTVRGHIDPKSGAVWTVDTIAYVHDEIEDVDEPLWISERTFMNDGNSGPQTELVLVRPGSFVF